MTRDAPAGTALPRDIPNAATQCVGFFARLLAAWARMGFRNPTVAVVTETDRA